MEKQQQQQLGRSVGVAGELRLYAAGSRRGRARGSDCPDARQACGTKNGEQRRAPAVLVWQMRTMHVKVSRWVCRRRASGGSRQGCLRTLFQSVVPGESGMRGTGQRRGGGVQM